MCKLQKQNYLLNIKIGIILGSGLSEFEKELSSPEILYQDSTSFHSLKVISGKINETDVVIFSGRRHLYEGYSMNEVLSNVNLAKELNINFLIVTNAAGGINRDFNVSDIMLITSHFNFTFRRIPVRINTGCYDRKLNELILKAASDNRIKLKSGSYCCASGPMYETKSEIRYFSKAGIDAVGMSTVPEILSARSQGIKTIAFSCITNLISENSSGITNHEEVVEAGKKAYSNFSGILKLIVSESYGILNS